MTTATDFTPNHLKIEGAYENDRNSENNACFKAIIREVYGVTDVICGHHLVYQTEEKRADGFTYQIVQEVPSADALLFDHDVQRKLFGEDKFRDVLVKLALEPIVTRDALMARLLAERPAKTLQ